MGKKPVRRVKNRGQNMPRPVAGGSGSGLDMKLKGDPHSQEEWQVRTRTWLNQEKGFDVFCLVDWFGLIFIFL